MRTLRIGTRGSQLALWQAQTVAARIEQAGGPACQLVIIKTSGDRLSEASLSDSGGKRLFVKEIEDALLGRVVDLAVHSAKDLPADLPGGLAVAGTLPREDPRDALVLPKDGVLVRPDGSTVWVAVPEKSPQAATVQPVPVAITARTRGEYAVEPETEHGRQLLVRGASVIIEGAERLTAGQSVRIVTLDSQPSTLNPRL